MNAEFTYTFTGITKAEADLIGIALGKLPMEQVLPLFSKLMHQATLQNPERATAVAAKTAQLEAGYGDPAGAVYGRGSAAEAGASEAPAPKKKTAKAKSGGAAPATVAPEVQPAPPLVAPVAPGLEQIPAFLQSAEPSLPPLPGSLIPQLPV